MQTTRTPRIVIEDLPALETLSEEEMARISGAGRFRPMLEVLEDRMLMSATALSNLPIPGTHTAPTVNFTLAANMDLKETIGNTTKDLGSAAGGQLYQGHDAVGHDVVYLSGNGHLYEFTPNSSFGTFTQISVSNNNQIVQDKALDLFFVQGSTLYEATGVPTTSSASAQKITTNVQSVYQAKDSSGQPAAYAVEGGKLYQVTGSGQQQVTGLTNVTQAVANGQGQLYVLQGTTLYTVSGTSSRQAATGVTQMAVDSAGEAIVLQGSNAYTYFPLNGLQASSGSSINSNPASIPQYALGAQGQLYSFQNGKLYVQNTSSSNPTLVASNLLDVLATGSSQIVYVAADRTVWQSSGNNSFQEIGISCVRATDGSIWYLDNTLANGGRQLYHLNNGGIVGGFGSFTQILGVQDTSVYAADSKNNVSIVNVRGSMQVPSFQASDGSIWFLGTTTVDSAGDHPILQFHNGTLSAASVSAKQFSVSGGTLAALNANGGLSILTAQGFVSVLQNVQGLTSLGNGGFAVQIGSLLKADIAVTKAASGAVTLSFTQVQLNVGPLGGSLNSFIQSLQNVSQTLNPLFAPIPGLQNLANEIGYKGSVDLASLLQTAAEADPDLGSQASSVTDALAQLQSLDNVINALPKVNGSWMPLSSASFTATISGNSLSINGLAGNLLQQLGGQFASTNTLFGDMGGIQVVSASSLVQSVLAGNNNVTLLNYNLSSIPNLSTSITVPLATVMPFPGVTLNGNVILTPSLQFGGSFAVSLSGLQTGNLSAALSGSAQVNASISVEAAASVDLGVQGLDIYGYLVGGTATLSTTGTFSQGSFRVSPLAVSDQIVSHPVGPNLNIAQFISSLAADDPMVLQYEVLQAGLSKVGVNLPTVQSLQSQASNTLTNLGNSLGIPSKPPSWL